MQHGSDSGGGQGQCKKREGREGTRMGGSWGEDGRHIVGQEGGGDGL